MEQLDSTTLIALVTMLAPTIAILIGTITPALVEGRAVIKALEGMTRQPEAANDLRGTLIVAMALLESTAIYVLLICLVLIFANPIVERLIPVG
jgi:F-type H+-transporting ATPase subunit c